MRIFNNINSPRIDVAANKYRIPVKVIKCGAYVFSCRCGTGKHERSTLTFTGRFYDVFLLNSSAGAGSRARVLLHGPLALTELITFLYVQGFSKFI